MKQARTSGFSSRKTSSVSRSVQTGHADIEQNHGNLFRVPAVEIDRFPAIPG